MDRNDHLNVLSLIASPSYSPASLAYLPQPVPNGLPPEADVTMFNFQDAFEDLLAVSGGLNLPSIDKRYHQRQLLRSMFPSGEPTWFWLRRLEAQGLVQRPTSAHAFNAHQSNWASFHDELDRKAAEAWHGVSKGRSSDDTRPNHLFADFGRAFRRIERGLMGDVAGNDNDSSDKKGRTQRRHEPDTLEELFSDLSSSFNPSISSWDTFVKTFKEDANDKGTGKSSAHHQSGFDGKVVTSGDEHVDRYGYLHKTVTRKTLDQEGNEVGSETLVTVRPADRTLDREYKGDGDLTLPKSDSAVKRSSWFWK